MEFLIITVVVSVRPTFTKMIPRVKYAVILELKKVITSKCTRPGYINSESLYLRTGPIRLMAGVHYLNLKQSKENVHEIDFLSYYFV